MQLIPRYLVKNRINIVADMAGFVVEYKPVYQREVQVYKGIDNVLQFRLLNADQKPIDTSLYTPKFKAFDENQNLILEYDGTVLDDGSTATKGLFTITVTENDLLNVRQQYLRYNLYLVDADNQNILTYTDTHFGNDATIKINHYAFPGPKPSKIVETFQRETAGEEIFNSETVDAEPGINGNEALHTAAIYTSGYEGKITIQATLDNQITGSNTWADLQEIDLDGTETGPVSVNFYGVFSFVRFKTEADPTDKIEKILVRN